MLQSKGAGAKMTVYIEYVLIDNVIIDYLLLKATFALTGNGYSKGRLLFCSFLGAVIALVYPLIAHVKFISFMVRILSGFLLTLVANVYPSKRAYLINTLIFFLLTFAVGGAIVGIYNIFGLDYSAQFSVAIMVLPVWVLIACVNSTIKYIYRRKDIEAFIFKVDITLRKKTATVRGFLDTGNGLYDGENPVVLCEKKFFVDFVGENLHKIKLKKIMVKTVSGSVENIAVELDQIKIYIEEQANIFNKVTLCVADTVGDGYDLILHPAFYKENSDERIKQVEKVS